MTTTRTHGPARWLARIVSTAATTAVALGVLLSTASVAAAEPQKPMTEREIRSHCRAAGGTYSSIDTGSGDHESTCKYKSISGKTYGDHYWNGTYTDTTEG